MIRYFSLIAAAAAIFMLASCTSTGSSTGVTRIDASTQTDLSGYWNDTDVRIVAESLVNECVNA